MFMYTQDRILLHIINVYSRNREVSLCESIVCFSHGFHEKKIQRSTQ